MCYRLLLSRPLGDMNGHTRSRQCVVAFQGEVVLRVCYKPFVTKDSIQQPKYWEASRDGACPGYMFVDLRHIMGLQGKKPLTVRDGRLAFFVSSSGSIDARCFPIDYGVSRPG